MRSTTLRRLHRLLSTVESIVRTGVCMKPNLSQHLSWARDTCIYTYGRAKRKRNADDATCASLLTWGNLRTSPTAVLLLVHWGQSQIAWRTRASQIHPPNGPTEVSGLSKDATEFLCIRSCFKYGKLMGLLENNDTDSLSQTFLIRTGNTLLAELFCMSSRLIFQGHNSEYYWTIAVLGSTTFPSRTWTAALSPNILLLSFLQFSLCFV